MSTFILSLTTQEIRAIAQMLHMRQLDSPGSNSATEALESLRQQTNLVVSNASGHGIFPNPVTAPEGAVQFNGSFYIPVL